MNSFQSQFFASFYVKKHDFPPFPTMVNLLMFLTTPTAIFRPNSTPAARQNQTSPQAPQFKGRTTQETDSFSTSLSMRPLYPTGSIPGSSAASAGGDPLRQPIGGHNPFNLPADQPDTEADTYEKILKRARAAGQQAKEASLQKAPNDTAKAAREYRKAHMSEYANTDKAKHTKYLANHSPKAKISRQKYQETCKKNATDLVEQLAQEGKLPKGAVPVQEAVKQIQTDLKGKGPHPMDKRALERALTAYRSNRHKSKTSGRRGSRSSDSRSGGGSTSLNPFSTPYSQAPIIPPDTNDRLSFIPANADAEWLEGWRVLQEWEEASQEQYPAGPSR
jgi:hypothetical protein